MDGASKQNETGSQLLISLKNRQTLSLWQAKEVTQLIATSELSVDKMTARVERGMALKDTDTVPDEQMDSHRPIQWIRCEDRF